MAGPAFVAPAAPARLLSLALLLAACHPRADPAADDQRQLNEAAAALDANAASPASNESQTP